VTASDHFNGRQFRVMDESGERPLDMTGKKIAKVPIEHLKAGMLAKPSWGDYPFRRLAGDSQMDPSHPAHVESDDPMEHNPMWLADYGRTFSPHQPEGTHYHVVRNR
jgi:hypothetical protein